MIPFRIRDRQWYTHNLEVRMFEVDLLVSKVYLLDSSESPNFRGSVNAFT